MLLVPNIFAEILDAMSLPNANASERRCCKCKVTKPMAEFSPTAFRCKPCDRLYSALRKASIAKGEWPERAASPVERKPAVALQDQGIALLAVIDEHADNLIAYGEQVVRACPRAHHALDVITSGWRNLGQPA